MSRNFDLLAEIEREREESLAPDFPEVSKPESFSAEPVLRAVPKEIIPPLPGGAGREEILRLVQNVFLSANGYSPRQIVFCGVDEKSGSSSICASAGRVLAAYTSKPVCLVDANLRTSELSRICAADRSTPISGQPASALEHCAQVGGNLSLAGASLLGDGCGALLPSADIKHRLTELRGVFEYLLVDAPGVIVSGDAAILGQVADAAVLVIEAGRTRRATAAKAKEILGAAGVRLLGTVLYNRSFPIPEGLYRKI